MAYERLVMKITKENLWVYILKMLMERPMYAYEISKNLKEKFGFSTAMITVYVVLYKMIREGLIQIRSGEKNFEKPNRKYYEITEKGKEAFLNGRNFLDDILKKLS